MIAANYFVIHYRSALDSIRRSKMQSVMVILSLAISSASMCLYLAISEQKPAESNSNTFLASFNNLTYRKDDEAFNKINEESIEYSLLSRDAGSIIVEDKSKNADILNVSPNIFNIIQLKILYGQEFDDKSNEQNIIIGNSLSKQIFERPAEAIGRHIIVNNKEKVVIGILSETNNFSIQPLNDLNNLIIGNLTSEDYVSDIVLDSKQGINLAQQDLKKYFPNLKDEFKVNTLELNDGGKAKQKLTENLRYSTRYTAFVALLLSGFCVFTTIMLSANQKIKEIGIRKTIGATNKQISMHFIYESLILGFIGGILGSIIAQIIVSVKLNNTLLAGTYFVSIKTSLLSLLSCLLISLIFGLIPAIKAGRKNPIECLKLSL